MTEYYNSQARSGVRTEAGGTHLVALLMLPALILMATALYAAMKPPAKAPVEEKHIASRANTQVRGSIPTPFSDSTNSKTASARTPTPVPKSPNIKVKTTESTGKWIAHKIRKGDTLSKVFSQLGLSQTLLHKIVTSSETAARLKSIRPGRVLKVHLNDAGKFMGLVYTYDPVRSLKISARGEVLSARMVERKVEHRVIHAKGTIENSLFLAAKKAGLSDTLTMELATIFGWDIDFALEIRPGDRFAVIYDEEWLDGKKLRDGPILAAEFVNRGHAYRAVRFQKKAGDAHYFTPEGKSMRKAFLRTPVKFSRISSRFTLKRWHPILKKWRSHKGVDYAAPRGTPVKAAGDGKVIFRGKKGGYGNVVMIKHGQRYTTVYGHLSRFARKVRRGSRVRQGQVIGYVGSTGLATGPHLHYEFRVNGVHRDPLKVKLPAAAPIAKKYRKAFMTQTRPLLSQLESLNETLVAHAN